MRIVMCMPTKNVYVSDGDLPLFDRAAELAGGMSPAIAAGIRLYVTQQEKQRKDTEMRIIELEVDEGNSVVATKRFSGRQILRSRLGDGQRFQTFRVYATAKGQYAVHMRDEPNWSGLTRGGDDALDDAASWEGDWWQSERSLHVFADIESMRDVLPGEVVQALIHLGDQPAVEDLDI